MLIANGASLEAARRYVGHTQIDMTIRYVYLLDERFTEQVLKVVN